METPAVPVAQPPRRPRLLAMMLAGTVLLIALIFYAGGFTHLRDENAFAERRVSFAWQDAGLDHVLGELFRDRLDVRFANPSDADMALTWTIKDMQEREVVRQLAAISSLRIRRIGDEVVVAKPSWTWHHYDACDRWFRERCGFSPWGRPASPLTSPMERY